MPNLEDLVDAAKIVGRKVYWRFQGQWRYVYDVMDDATERARLRNERMQQLIEEQANTGRNVVFGADVPFDESAHESASRRSASSVLTSQQRTEYLLRDELERERARLRVIREQLAHERQRARHAEVEAYTLPAPDGRVLVTTDSGELRWEVPVSDASRVDSSSPPLVDPQRRGRKFYTEEERDD